jgi:integrase
MTGVISFYKTNAIELPTLPKMKTRPLEKHNDIPTKEDIQQVLKVCTLIEKAIILVGVSSGLSANEITNLKVKDFKKGYDPITSVTTLKLRREKVQYDFITFLSSEASNAVQDYINYRNREVENCTTKRQEQLYKQRVFNDSNFLFITHKIPNSFLSTKNDIERKLSHAAFMKMYQAITEKAQKEVQKGDWNLIRSHNMRKYFNSALLNAGADIFFVDYLMGHTVDATKTAYFRADSNKLRIQYMKYTPFLTIEKSIDVSESEDFKRIKSEHETLLIEAEKHRVERQELQDLRVEVDKLKNNEKRLGQMSRDIKTIHAKIHDDYFKDKDVREDIKAHEERMKVDPEYREQFNIYDRAYKILELGEGTREEFNEMLEKEDKDIMERKTRLLKTYDKFLDKL